MAGAMYFPLTGDHGSTSKVMHFICMLRWFVNNLSVSKMNSVTTEL